MEDEEAVSYLDFKINSYEILINGFVFIIYHAGFMGRLNTAQLLLLHSSFISKETLSCGRIKLSGAAVIKTALLLLSAAYLFVVPGCKKESPAEPGPATPPGYQEDIPWPSLADSPWPMAHHDPQNSGRSRYIGPRGGIVHKIIDVPEIAAGIIADHDGNIYFTSSDPNQNISGLYAIDADGNLRWKYTNTLSCWASPIAASSGNILFMDIKSVFSISRNGVLNWEYIKEYNPASVLAFSIGKNGDLFFLDQSGKLYSVSSTGTQNWTLEDNSLFASIFNNLVFSPDGKTIYTLGWASALIAINSADGTVKWRFGEGGGINQYTPVIDTEGNIYLQALNNRGETVLFSVKENGNVRWEVPLAGEIAFGGTIDKYGNFYAASDTLYKVNYNGEIVWKLYLNGLVDFELLNDAEGYIYAGVLKDLTKKTDLLCIKPDGTILWELEFEHGFSASPALIQGKLYITDSRNKKLYIIK